MNKRINSSLSKKVKPAFDKSKNSKSRHPLVIAFTTFPVNSTPSVILSTRKVLPILMKNSAVNCSNDSLELHHHHSSALI